VSLTFHNSASGGQLVCHYCGYHASPPPACPSCKGTHLQYRGYGTQKLEEELGQLFLKARVLRLDADTTSGKMSHDKILGAFRARKADILVGTQMVAKGHDFPGVTLVGVIMADLSLFLSDYRAGEHSFSLLTQVAGRSGREKPGRAVIQTLNPFNEVLQLVPSQDYDSFYQSEIALRRAVPYPPFCDICMFTLSAEDEGKLMEAGRKLADFFKERLTGSCRDQKMIVYGPFEAMPYKLKNTYRLRMAVIYKNSARARSFFREVLEAHFSLKSNVGLTADVNPSMI
jgi:primosomal protein N' (replication factor Y)